MYLSNIYRVSPEFIGFLNRKRFIKWIDRVLSYFSSEKEISIYIASLEEMRTLNRLYRGRDYPTNVLSFSSNDMRGFNFSFLGDLIICHEILKKEAKNQRKSIDSHWAHIIIHGCLHLLGIHHQNEIDLKKMESMEIKILKRLGYPNPFY